MNIREATSLFRYYQQSNRRKRTRESYRFLLQHMESLFGDRELDSIKPDEIYHLLENILRESAKSTRRLRYAQLKAFFNFMIEKCYPDLKNPCNAPLLSKTFRIPRRAPKTILEKELVDEMYKYVPPERIDILTNGFVRFTQPCAFNDPFETFPCFTAGMPDEYIKDFLSNHEPDKLEQEQTLRASIEAEMSKYPGLKVPFETIKDSSFFKAALNQLYPMAASLFTQFMSGSGDLFSPLTIKIVLETINKQFGALCLTESPRNLLMWAHYSASHSGFLLEFDENHSFFDRRVKAKELARYLKKVHYTRARPQTVLFDARLKKDDCRDTWATSIFFSKSEHWAYEEEWRIVEYLKECKHIVRSEPYDIYLFPVPMGCITGIIFGCKMLDTTKSIIKHLVRTDPNCSHIRLSEATIDEKEYRLNISAVT